MIVRGIFRLVVVLQTRQKLRVPNHVKRGLKARFEQRYAFYSAFRLPYVLTYEDFAQACEGVTDKNMDAIWRNAQESLQDGQTMLTKLISEQLPPTVRNYVGSNSII